MEQITGNHLKQLRLHYRGKQKGVAEALRIPQLELKSWEKEDFLPDDEKIRDYIIALRSSTSDAVDLTFELAMSFLEKMDGESLQEIRPVITHSRPEFQTGQREEIDGEIVQPQGNNQRLIGKINFSVGSSLQISDSEWTRVTVGVELPFALDQYEEVKNEAIRKARTVLQDEIREVVLATAEAAGKDIRARNSDGDFAPISESLRNITENAPRSDGTSITKASGSAPAEWDPLS